MRPPAAKAGCGCLLGLVIAFNTALFLLAFALLFIEGPRNWIAETFVGCDGPTEEFTTTDFDGESSSTYYCEKDGETQDVTGWIALYAFAPFAISMFGSAVLGIVWKVTKGAFFLTQFLGRGRRRGPPGFGGGGFPPQGPGGWPGQPGGWGGGQGFGS